MAGNRDDGRFRDQLAVDAAACGAQRGSHRELALAGDASREEHRCKIHCDHQDGDDDEHSSDPGNERDRLGHARGDQPGSLRERDDFRVVEERYGIGVVRTDAREVGIHARNAGPRFQPAHQLQRALRPVLRPGWRAIAAA